MSFYRMKAGLIELSLLTIIFSAISGILVYFFFASSSGSTNPELWWLWAACCLMPVWAFWGYVDSYRTEEKNPLWMKVFVNEYGLSCLYKNMVMWSCAWEEIDSIQRCRYKWHFCRRVVLKESVAAQAVQQSFYYECSRAAKLAMRQYCPQKLLTQL